MVCAPQEEYLPIAAMLTATGRADSIEWVSDPVKAYTCAARRRAAGRTDVIVGGRMDGAVPSEVACTLAGLVDGMTVLCADGALGASGETGPCGVRVVDRRGLVGLLLEAPSDEMGVCGESLAVGSLDAAGDLEEPEAREAHGATGDDSVDVAPGADGQGGAVLPSGPAGDQCHAQALRTMGRLPRNGVPGNPATARALDRSLPQVDDDALPVGGDVALPGSSAGDAPALSEEPSRQMRAEGRTVGGIATEPVVFSPVVSLPQLECSVAGEDDHVPTICVSSSRGGVGKTSLAVLVAVALAREGLSVSLIDLDFQFGTCLGYLGADETDGLFDAGAPPRTVRVDARTLARCRTTPEARLAAFEFCKAPEHAEVLAGMAGKLIRCARAGSDVAVVDLPSGVSEVCAQAFETADRCLLVADQRAFAIESLVAQQTLCARMGVARTKLVTVMNRCDARHRDEGFLSRVQFEVQTPQLARVVDGGPEVMQMMSIGSAAELLTMRNKFALSVADLAHMIAADLGCRSNFENVLGAAPVRLSEAAPKTGAPKLRKRGKRGVQEPCPF